MRSLPLASAIAVSLWAVAANAQSLADGPPKDNFNFTTWASGLDQLTDFRFLPDGRAIIISKGGQVRVRTAAGMLVNAGSFQVDTESEKGLLGVEVHPQFATNKTVFFYYSRANAIGGTDLDRHHVISMTLKDDNTLDTATLKVLVKDLRGPANHDGGGLALSKDGTKLFIGVGDTGCNKSPAPPSPPGNYFPTCLTNANGKVLRVNLDGTIPADNPITEAMVEACGSSCGTEPSGMGPPRKEIWAWGFRNPWRIWNDPVTDKLWVGDVGEGSWEEIDIVEKRKHYGWPWREGKHGWPVTKCAEDSPSVGDCVEPVHEQSHSRASVRSINGGLIVDSCDWPAAFRGLYYFGDNVTGALWTIQPTPARDGVVAGSEKDFGSVPNAVSFQVGPDKALYIGSLTGRIIRFEPKMKETCPAPMPDAGPETTPGPDTGVPPGDDAGPVTDSSVGGTDDAGGNNTDPGTADEGGCGCSTPGSGAARHGTLALALALLFMRRRR